MESVPTPKSYRAGPLEVHIEARLVTTGGKQLDLQWRHFEALRLLVEARGKAVDKEVLFRELWPGVTVDESNLTKCINGLRRAINAGSGDCIETIPRVGYRFALPVEEVAVPVIAGPPQAKSPRWRWWASAAAAACIAAGGFVWQQRSAREARAEDWHNQGLKLRRQRQPGSINGAIDAFRHAIQENPGKAIYYAALTEALTQLPAKDTEPRVLVEVAEKGVATDSRCGNCQAMLGYVLFTRVRDWERAGQHLRQALALVPADSGTRGYFAMYMASQGKFDEALAHIDTGLRHDPYFATLHSIRGTIFYLQRRHADVIRASAEGDSLGQSRATARDWASYAFFELGRDDEALVALAKSIGAADAAVYARALAKGGRQAALSLALEDTSTEPNLSSHAYRRAHWRMLCGDHAGALAELEHAVKARAFSVIYTAVDPAFARLHDEPRFHAVLEELRLRPVSISKTKGR